MVGINVIPGLQPPQSGVSAERARERLDFLVPYDVPGGYSYTPPQPEMNTLGLLADPNIGPQSIVAVPLGRAGAVGERTGVINPATQEETAAQQYMREAQERRKVEPTSATTEGLKLGNAVGDNNRERSLLERMVQSGLLSTLQGMARAERMYGVGPLAAFSESALDVQAAQAAADQKRAEAQLELDKERIKAQPKPPKPTSEITNLYKEMGVYQSGLNTFNRIKSILSKSIATGAAGSTLAGLNNIAAAFNINLSPDAQTSVNKAVAEIRTQLIASKAYGREANKDEQKLIRALIPEAGTFKTIKELEQAYDTAAASMKRKANETNAIMTGVYGLPSYGTVVPSSPLFTRPNQGK